MCVCLYIYMSRDQHTKTPAKRRWLYHKIGSNWLKRINIICIYLSIYIYMLSRLWIMYIHIYNYIHSSNVINVGPKPASLGPKLSSALSFNFWVSNHHHRSVAVKHGVSGHWFLQTSCEKLSLMMHIWCICYWWSSVFLVVASNG